MNRTGKLEAYETFSKTHKGRTLFQHGHFIWAVIAQFFYVAAQVGIAALFINYCTEKNLGITNTRAAYLLSGSLLLFTFFISLFLIKFSFPITVNYN